MITQNHIIIAIFVEFAVFYLLTYTIIRANKWVNQKQEEVNEYLYILPYKAIELRESLKLINTELNNHYKEKPFDAKELGYFAGEVFSDLLKLKLTGGGLFKNKFVLFSLATKFWNNKNRLLETMLRIL